MAVKAADTRKNRAKGQAHDERAREPARGAQSLTLNQDQRHEGGERNRQQHEPEDEAGAARSLLKASPVRS
jgi:hypothetical protein